MCRRRALAAPALRRLSSLVGIGSDVFGILGPQAEVSADRIAEMFSLPFEMREESFRLSVTTGLTRLGDTSMRSVELLKNAGIALKQAKSFYRGKAVFLEMSHATAARERMQMLSRLRTAFPSVCSRLSAAR